MIKLGEKVTDALTGFTGTAMSRTEYLNEQHVDVESAADRGGPQPNPPETPAS